MSHCRFEVHVLGLVLLGVLCGGRGEGVVAQDRSVSPFGPLLTGDTVEAEAASLGRMWSVAEPPRDRLASTYGTLEAPGGFEPLRHSVVRLPGCTGTIVSATGLVLTAARCVPEGADADEAVLAETQEQESVLEEMYAERLVGVDDVTARVDSVRERLAADGDSTAWRTAVGKIEQDWQEQGTAPRRVDVVREAGGDRYVAYTYRRYEDVRLVFRPEIGVTARGQVEGSRSYPRHVWDIAALRIYEDEEPLRTPEHIEVREQGTRPGDAVFAAGYPAEHVREETATQQAFRRDVILPLREREMEVWTSNLQAYVDTATGPTSTWQRRLRDGRMHERTVRTRLAALRSDYVMERLRERDEQLRQQAGDEAQRLLDAIATLQEKKRTFVDAYRAFSPLRRAEGQSATLARALIAYRAYREGRSPSETVLRAVPEQPVAVDAALMAHYRGRLRSVLDEAERTDDPIGESENVVRESAFSDEQTALRWEPPTEGPITDPALRVVSTFYEAYTDFWDDWSSIQDRERRLTAALERIWHQHTTAPMALPRQRALRVADGRIASYPYNGTVAPPRTTFYGLYGRHASNRRRGAPGIPSRWISAENELDRSTPLAVVSRTDMMEAPGGPLLDASLRLVGIQFDTNVQGAAGVYAFLPRRMRTVSVDVRGVIAGLRSIYGADRLVRELRTATPSSK